VEDDYPNAGKCSAYMCGHKNMISDATELLLKLGCPKERIYKERFA
jgi:ferredoxin-NADP reductase